MIIYLGRCPQCINIRDTRSEVGVAWKFGHENALRVGGIRPDGLIEFKLLERKKPSSETKRQRRGSGLDT